MRQLDTVNDDSFLVVVEPSLSRFKACDYRVPSEMKMLGRVLIRRGVATTYVSALCTAPQVQPPTAARQAFDAAVAAWSYLRIDSANAAVLTLHCASTCKPRRR